MDDGLRSLLLFAALAAVPVLGVAVLNRVASAREQALWARFRASLEAYGASFGGPSTPNAWNATASWDDAHFAIERAEERVRSGTKTVKAERRVVRMLDPVHLADALIVSTSRPFEPPPGLHEVPLEPELALRLRAFAARPDELASWLGPDARRALLAMSDLARVTLVDGNMAITLSEPLSNAESVLAALDWLAAVPRGRAPRLFRAPSGADSNRWVLAALLPPAVAFLLAFILPVVPGVAPLASGIVCEEGQELEMVWTRKGNKSTGNLRCVRRATRAAAAEARFFVPYAVFFDAVYLPLTAALVISALRSPKVAPVARPEASRGPAYRGWQGR